MHEQHHTSVGYPLPDYVRYEPSICPIAESSAQRLVSIGMHHGMTDPEHIRILAGAIAATASKYL